MSPETKLLINKFVLNYCVYEISEKLEYKDPSRVSKYNLLYDAKDALEELLFYDEDEDDINHYEDIMNEYNISGHDEFSISENYILNILSNLELGYFYQDDNSDLHDMVFDLSGNISIDKVFNKEFLDKLWELLAYQETRNVINV